MLSARCAMLSAVILVITAQGVCAQDTPGILLEDLSWTEIRDQVKAGTTTILIPIGGTEQSGPYIAVGKHNARVAALAQRIAERLGHTLVAPVVSYVPEGSTSPPTQHMRFPGTITMRPEAFESMLESAGNSFMVHGFRTIVFLGDHGGYQENLRHVAARLNTQWAGHGAQALAPPEFYAAATTDYGRILQAHGVRSEEIGTHAALADTSLQLALVPRMVRQDKIKTFPPPGPADGVYGGDPRGASAELGQLGVDAIVSRTVTAIRGATKTR